MLEATQNQQIEQKQVDVVENLKGDVDVEEGGQVGGVGGVAQLKKLVELFVRVQAASLDPDTLVVVVYLYSLP